MIFSCNSFTFHKKVYQNLTIIIRKLIAYLRELKIFKPEQPEIPTLEEEIAAAHDEWVSAKKVFEEINVELIDYAVFRLNAAERKYMYLLQEAKKSGMTAWEEQHVDNC